MHYKKRTLIDISSLGGLECKLVCPLQNKVLFTLQAKKRMYPDLKACTGRVLSRESSGICGMIISKANKVVTSSGEAIWV